MAVQWWRKGLKLLAHAIHISLQSLIWLSLRSPSQTILFETINNNGVLKSNKNFFQYISLSLLLVMMLHVKWARIETEGLWGNFFNVLFDDEKVFSRSKKFQMHFKSEFDYCKFNAIREKVWESFQMQQPFFVNKILNPWHTWH